MKHDTKTFTPADGVTMENALRYIEAVDQAVRIGITRLPKEERSMVIGVIAGSIAQTAESLRQFRNELERNGQATPVTQEQKQQLRMMFRLARAKDAPES